jgi:E3 ubiquitin-protein ligase Topors
LLEAKAKREAEETDLGLKRLDIIDRKKEVRRRLMVLKMMAAETDQERRARELRDRLMARKRGNLGLGVTVAA